MKKTAILAATALLLLAPLTHAHQLDGLLSDANIKLAFERGLLNKSELAPVTTRLKELLSSDGSIDQAWLKEQGLVQLETDLTTFGTVKLTDGKKVLKVALF